VAKYDLTFWRRVLRNANPAPLMGTLKRLVENQEQKVTVGLVDSFAEHEVLESLLDDSKPRFDRHQGIQKLDYLLRTPWRYPPLQWGSRFGRNFEPSLFYGSLTSRALFAEAAYYRLVFLEGMQTPFKDRVISQFTVFEARYQTDTGFDLGKRPFTKHELVLRHKSRYRPCQNLGTELRDRGIEAIAYLSARTEGDERNIALLTPSALRSRKHFNPQHGLCESKPSVVNFRLGDELHTFHRKQFLDHGKFPQPA